MALNPIDLAKEYEYLDDMLVGEIIESVATERPDDDTATHELAVREILAEKSSLFKSVAIPKADSFTPPPAPFDCAPPKMGMFGNSHFVGRPPFRRAVLIGINYTHSRSRTLKHCVEDVAIFKNLLVSHYGWKDCEFHILTDVSDPDIYTDGVPTEKNILEAIDGLVKDAIPGDCLVFFFSGHGDNRVDDEGIEDDGFDEAIISSDDMYMFDFTLCYRLCSDLVAGVSLTCIFDSCYSGTILDLRYHYQTRNCELHEGFESLANIVCVSACRDGTLASGTPYYWGGPLKGSVLTTALAVILTEKPISLLRLLDRLAYLLAINLCRQRPTISSSKLIREQTRVYLSLP